MSELPPVPQTESEKGLEAEEFITRVLNALDFDEKRRAVENTFKQAFGEDMQIVDFRHVEGNKYEFIVNVGEEEKRVIADVAA